MIVNGFEIKGRLVGTPQCYYTAKRGNIVHTSQLVSYLIKKANEYPPPNEIGPCSGDELLCTCRKCTAYRGKNLDRPI